MNSSATAFAVLAAAARPGHKLGDYVTGQTDGQARHKAAPGYGTGDSEVSRARSWGYNLAHVAAYHATLTAVAAVTLAATGVRIRPRRAAGALAISVVSHSVIDRRWPVRLVMQWTGSAAHYPRGAPEVDQALHEAFLWAAALYAARGATVRQ